MGTVNLRAKMTASEEAAIIALWNTRRNKVTTRKKYEDEIEKDNQKLANEVMRLLLPVAISQDTPVEFIIESHRSIVQIRVYSSPKAKGQQFVTTVSQSIAPIELFMENASKLRLLGPTVKASIRRMKTLVKKNLGVVICPNNRPPMGRIQDLRRQPSDPMIVVSFNIRTRYDL